MDRGRTTHVPARGKTRKKPGSIFHRPPPHRPLLAGADISLCLAHWIKLCKHLCWGVVLRDDSTVAPHHPIIPIDISPANPEVQGEIIYTPPPPPISGHKAFLGEGGGGGVYFEAPRGRNFIRPPPPFIHPPPLGGYFQGWGGGGV